MSLYILFNLVDEIEGKNRGRRIDEIEAEEFTMPDSTLNGRIEEICFEFWNLIVSIATTERAFYAMKYV